MSSNLTVPRILIDAPPVTPAPFGLFSVVASSQSDTADVHWQEGIMFRPLPGNAASSTTAKCPPTANTYTKAVNVGIPTAIGNAFTVYRVQQCAPVGNTYEEATTRARQALLLTEGPTVEQVVWNGITGSDPVVPTIINAADTVLTSGAVSPMVAMGLLEQAITANYGGVGVIHVPRFLIPLLSRDRYLDVVNGVLRTLLGTPVSAGSGYTNVDRSNVAASAGTAWMYATGNVKLLRSEVFVPPANQAQQFGRTLNDQTVIAERTYIVSWDAPLHAPDGNGYSVPQAWAAQVTVS